MWFNPNVESLQLGSLTDYEGIIALSAIKEGFSLVSRTCENRTIIDYFKRLREKNLKKLQGLS